MTERDRGGIAAVLTADAHLEVGAGLAATLHTDLYQFTDAVAIDRNKRIDLENSARDKVNVPSGPALLPRHPHPAGSAGHPHPAGSAGHPHHQDVPGVSPFTPCPDRPLY